jgi:hypothetical protein
LHDVTTGRRLPPPLPLRVAKTGRNHLNEEITPILPKGLATDLAKPFQI